MKVRAHVFPARIEYGVAFFLGNEELSLQF
jgi:hypothetical protein